MKFNFLCNSNFYKRLLIVLFVSSIVSCTKTEEVTIHENAVIENNEIPPNYAVSDILVDNYINKIFIDLWGKEPSETQLTYYKNQLKTNNFSIASRESMIQNIQSSWYYYDRLFNVTSSKFLNSLDSITIVYSTDYIPTQISDALANGDYSYAMYLQNFLNTAQDLNMARTDLFQNNITINEFFKRIIFNGFYDEINMGSANFILATFQNLFRRFPTASELEIGINMVEGDSQILFGQDGANKSDCINIMVQSQSFYEGLTFDTYEKLLVRNPSSAEMVAGANTIRTQSLQQLQITLIKSKEYAGF